MRLDQLHSSWAVLHRDRIILAWVTIRVDYKIPESAVRPRALGVGVADETDHGSVERNAHVKRAGVRREHERRRIENRNEISQAAPQLGARLVLRALHHYSLRGQLPLGPAPNKHDLHAEVLM